jgi:hypothetical protein
MGLDITAYSRVVLEKDVEVDEYGSPRDWNKYRVVYVNDDFPGREGSIVHRGVYSFDKKLGFRVGGYGYYSGWREMLAKMAGYPATPHANEYQPERLLHAAACWNGATGPFSELINFADNEGVLGPEVCAKLAKDFAEFETMAVAFARTQGDEDFIASYLKWKQAFDLAADGGMVDFH